MSVGKQQRPSAFGEFLQEFPTVWKNIPAKGVFVLLLTLWVLFFEFLGNSTFGYIKTRSLFAWSFYSYGSNADDEHGMIIPLVVLVLFWIRRKDFEKITSSIWAPGLVLVGAALLLHIIGYLAQQARISLAAFFLGLYALIAVVWGPRVLKASFFPMCLFAFALPLGTLAESITHPLRMLATKLSAGVASGVGINVIHRGTQIFSPDGSYQYEVAAACSGLRSLTAVLALCTIYAFMNLKGPGRRLFMIASAFPLAVAGNVMRLLAIIVAAEIFGQKWGNWVHDNTVMSLIPYVPPILGIVVLGFILKQGKKPDLNEGLPMEQPA
jgi:exosortase